MLAFRLLEHRGEIDVDAFFARTPASKWAEYKIAKAINDSYDEWIESRNWPYLNKRPWEPPRFEPQKPKKPSRRRFDGSEH